MKNFLATAAFVVAATFCGVSASAFDEFNVWPDVAPGASSYDVKPTYEYWKPTKKSTDACLVVCPGGAYNRLAYEHEGKKIAQFFTDKGVTVVVLKYRVPRPKNTPKHLAAWQDAQRATRCPQPRRRVGNRPGKNRNSRFLGGRTLDADDRDVESNAVLRTDRRRR